jgi:hypothetical protein
MFNNNLGFHQGTQVHAGFAVDSDALRLPKRSSRGTSIPITTIRRSEPEAGRVAVGTDDPHGLVAALSSDAR